MSPNAYAAGNGLAPTGIVSITVLVAGSMRETVSEPTLGTKTVPSSATAAFSGPWPTRMVATTFRVLRSIRETVFELLFDTQAESFVTASDRGAPPPRTAVTLLVRASTRKTRRPYSEPTQAAPPPYRRLAGAEQPLILILRVTLFVFGFIRTTFPSDRS